jgi:hypothetical protein
MAEQIDLAAPAQTNPGTNYYRVDVLMFDLGNEHIRVELVGDQGLRRAVDYQAETATSLMRTLNKANLSAKSLHRRIIELLVADGHLVGTISGEVE